MTRVKNWMYGGAIMGIIFATQTLVLMGCRYWKIPYEPSLWIIFVALAPVTEEAAKRWSGEFVWVLIATEIITNYNTTVAMLGINPGIVLIGLTSVKVVFHYYTTYPITTRNYWAGVAIHVILNIPGTYGMTYGKWNGITIAIAAWATLAIVAVVVQIYLGRSTKNNKEVM